MIAFLGSLLAFSTLASTSSLIKFPGVEFLPPGCAAGSILDQKIVFNSGAHRYNVFVPANSMPFTLGGATKMKLNCVNESMSGGPCTTCDVKVDHVQLLNPGTCEVVVVDYHGTVRSFNISSTDKQVFFGTPGYPWEITCQPPAGSHLLGRESASGPLCPETGGSSVTLGVGVNVPRPHKYLMTVPADKKLYRVEAPNEQLRCVGPLGDKYSMCLPCDQDISSIQVSEQALTCAFNITEYSHKIVLNTQSTATPFKLDQPGKLLDVMCGFPNIVEANARALSEAISTSSVSTGSTLTSRNDIDSTACMKNDNDILVRTWSQGSEYHTYIAPKDLGWKYWQTNDTQVGCIPVAADQSENSPICTHCSSHIDAALVEGPSNAYCDVIRIGPYDNAFVTAALFSGVNHTFDASDERQIIAIFCDLYQGDSQVLASLSARSLSENTTLGSKEGMARIAAAEISMPWAFNHVNSANFDQTTCPSNGYHFTIMSADGNAFFPAFPADGHAHMVQDLSCVSLSDLSCSSCNNAGPAIGVTAEYQFGPCTVKTRDGRTFEITDSDRAPQDTNLTPKVLISPPATITEIKCGY